MGWFMQIILNRLLPSSPVPLPLPPGTIRFRYLVHSSGVPTRTEETTLSADIPITTFLRKV